MLSATDTALLFLGCAIVVLWFNKKTVSKPPGPPGLPIIGNLLDMPSGRDWEVFGRWGETYGPLISLTVGPTTVVVINTYKKAQEILDKKGPIYSSRPYVAMAGDLMGWQKSTGLLVYGPDLTKTRKLFHQELGSASAICSFWPQEEFQARKFLELCTDHPERLRDNCFQHAGAIIFRIAYGYTAKNYDDEWIATTNAAMHTFNMAAAPGAFLVNQLPFLRHLPDWFPGTDFKRKAREWAPQYLDMIGIPFEFVKQGIASGTAEDSFTAKWLKRKLSLEDEEILRHGSGAMLGAGSETTAITIHCFFLMMALHPEVQKKAQAEVDDICGRERLPHFGDREHLPYLEALIKEVTRMHPSVPSGIPHTTTEDDVHDDYYIPKGTIVIANIWQMTRDRNVYTRPFAFDPERFLGPNPEQDPYELIFGFGRRLCPGRLLADASLYITMAMCLSAFDVSLSKDDAGNPIIPELLPVPGTVSALTPFECTITPRFPQDQLDELIRH
ncbi:cytochrome P450 [Mucidula mucida]|nr:cytochrome P450 [Mucidula mucida]